VTAAASSDAAATAAGDGAPGDEAAALALRRADFFRAIAAEPHRFDFFHAMRLIEALHPDRPRLGQARRPADEPVRMGQAADLSFATSTLSKVVLGDRCGRPRVEVRFFGLFGPNGPLPLHLTAYARERRLHKGDETFGRFADWFHHRLLLMFYRAWAQAQPTASLDRPGEDRFADYVGSLVGHGGKEWQRRDAAPDHARLAFSGLLSRQARNADGLARLLTGFLSTPVRVESFVGRWMPLPESERTRIGRRGVTRRLSSSQLGASAVMGRSVFDRQHHFSIHIGPLSRDALESLLPTGSALPAVQALVRQWVGLEFGWDLRLRVADDQRPACRPGRQGRLGWTTWLGRREGVSPCGPTELTLVPNTATP
jgi:type VI secretion system protein ImpH